MVNSFMSNKKAVYLKYSVHYVVCCWKPTLVSKLFLSQVDPVY